MNASSLSQRIARVASGIAALCLAPALANAALVLDTGTPTTGASLEELTTSQWFAAEFSLSAGQTVTSLSTYLSGLTGASYTLDIFSGSFTGVRLGQQTLDYTTTGTFSSNNAWNTTSANYTATTTGNYWVAIEVTSLPRGSELNLETTPNNGTAPAEAFAYLGSNTNGQFQTSGAPDVAFQVNATPVPLPPSAWLLGGGLLAFLGLRRSGVAVGKRL